YGVFSQVLRRYLQIEGSEPPAVASQKVARQLKALDVTIFEVARPYLLNLLDLPETGEAIQLLSALPAAQLRQYTFLAVRSLLTHLATQEPFVLVIEDIQWLDEASLDLLLFLLRSPEPIPLFICCTARPAAGPALDKTDQVARECLPERYHRLDLRPLSATDNLALLRSLPTLAPLPEAVERQIVGKAQGNPLYTEELLGLWSDQGTLQTNGSWPAGGEDDPAEAAVPVTLDRSIMARVDSLGPQARYILQSAAVLGRRFSLPLLRQLISDSAPDLDFLIKLLEQRGIIQAANGKTAAEYEFRQSLTRDSVYNSLLFRRRKQLHREVAAILEKTQAKGRANDAETIAYHYWHSDEPSRAIPFLLQAAECARQRLASQSAIAFYEQALSLMDEQPDTWVTSRISTHVGLGELRSLTGAYRLAIADYESALALLADLDKPDAAERIAAVCARLGHTCQGQGDFEGAGRWLDKGLAALEEAGVPSQTIGRARIFSEKGWLDSLRGANESALNWLSRAIPILEQLNHPAELASAYNRLGVVFYKLGQLSSAQTYFQKGLALRQQLGDLDGLARSHNNLAATAFSLLDWEQAISYLRSSLELHRRTGYTEGVIDAQHNLAIVHLARGEWGNGLRKLKAAINSARSLSNPRQVALVLSDLGELDIQRGRLQEAIAHLTEAQRVALAAGVVEAAVEAEWRLAWAYLEMGELDKARPHALEAVQQAEARGSQELLGDSLRILGVLQGWDGQHEAAEHSLQASIRALQTTGQRFKAARSQLALGQLYTNWARVSPSPNGRSEKARTLYQAALEVFAAVGAQPAESVTRAALAALPS
ncbi:MAG: tetratricopeptide repeat protein, partial [Chloroflexota bacterium]